MRERLTRLKSASGKDWEEIKKPWDKKDAYEDDEDEILKETKT